MKIITRRPLPLTLAFAWFVPSLVIIVIWVGHTIGLSVPDLGAREYAWVMTTLMGAVVVFGIARLEGSRKEEERPGVRRVLDDLKQAEVVAARTEAAVKELVAALEEQGIIATDDADQKGDGEAEE